MPRKDRQDRIATAIKKMPQWLRHDLNAADPAARERAHDALAAMILAVLDEAPTS